MNSLFGRYFAALIGFGFVAMWVSVGLASAVLCLVGAAVFFFGSALVQRRRVDSFTTRFAERSQTMRTAPARPSRRAV